MGINNVSSLEGDMFEEKLKSSKPIEDFTSVRKTGELETYQKLITGELTYNDHSHIMDEMYCSIITAFKEHLKRIGTYGYDGYNMYGYNGERTYEIPSGDSVMKVRINHSQYNHHRMNIFINNHKLSIIISSGTLYVIITILGNERYGLSEPIHSSFAFQKSIGQPSSLDKEVIAGIDNFPALFRTRAQNCRENRHCRHHRLHVV